MNFPQTIPRWGLLLVRGYTAKQLVVWAWLVSSMHCKTYIRAVHWVILYKFWGPYFVLYYQPFHSEIEWFSYLRWVKVSKTDNFDTLYLASLSMGQRDEVNCETCDVFSSSVYCYDNPSLLWLHKHCVWQKADTGAPGTKLPRKMKHKPENPQNGLLLLTPWGITHALWRQWKSWWETTIQSGNIIWWWWTCCEKLDIVFARDILMFYCT